MIRRILFERFGTLLVVLCALQLVVALTAPLGCLLVDEVVYHAMTRSLAHGATFDLGNGFALVASPELEWENARAVGGRLVAQYPYGHSFLVAPLYRLLGLRAFFVVSTIAFWATVHVCRSVAQLVLRKRSLAIGAAMVFALATYAWEYSLGMWPHATMLLLTTAAVRFAFAATEDRPIRRQLAAGALVGAAMTMRLDAVFALAPVVLFPALLMPRTAPRVRAAAAGVLGIAPAMLFLALVNLARFDTWQPLSYGPWHGATSNTGLLTYAPFATLGIVACVLAFAIDPSRVRPRHLAIAAAAAALVVALVPPLRAKALVVARDAYTILVDLRAYDRNAVQPALSRSPRGAMMYIGAFKKSFVQSLPWLPLALAAPFFRGAPRRRLAAAALPLVAFAGVFAALGWHGGLCLNLRYLLPALPFASILATYSGYRLVRRTPWAIARLREIDVAFVCLVAVWLVLAVVVVMPSSIGVKEVFFVDAPMVLAVLLGAALLARKSSAALAVAAVAAVWAGMMELSYDAVATLRTRIANQAIASSVRAVAPPGSFVFAEYPDIVSGALEDDDVLVQPSRDGFATAPNVLDAARANGRASFAVLAPPSLARLPAGEPLASSRGWTIRRLP